MNEPKMTNEQGWPVCGHSWHLADLTSGYVLHYAPAEALAKHNGVCEKCAAAIKKRNGYMTHQKVEQSAAMNHKLSQISVEQDHACWTEKSEIEPVVDFPFDELDQQTAEFFNGSSEDVRCETARALGLILAWIWSSGWQTAQRRFAAFSASLRPDLLEGMTYENIGKELGCTKAAISKAALVCGKQFNMRWSRSRTEEARERMAAAARGHAGRDTTKRSAPAITTPRPAKIAPTPYESYQKHPSSM